MSGRERNRDSKERRREDHDTYSQYDLSPFRLQTEEHLRTPVQRVPNTNRSPFRLQTEDNLCTSVERVRIPAYNDKYQEEAMFYGQREKDDIRIVLLGRTGSGKSATGNTILTKKEFQSKASGSSITEQCQIAENRSANHRFLVVDTPGLFDTKLPQGEITREIIRCIHMSTPGPHAFLLVLRLDRFTQEEIDTFSCLFDLFGENMSSYAIIVFTRLDDIEEENVSVEDFIDSSNKNLKHFISKVEGRYIAFNNRGTEQQKNQQVANLTRTLEQMIQNNGGKHYTNQMYEEAEENLRRKIMEVERIKALEKQKEVEKIESKFKGEMSKLENSNTVLEKEIRLQKAETTNVQLDKKKKEATIKQMESKMEQMDKKHEKELYNAILEQRRIEERKMQDLKSLEEKNKREIQKLLDKNANNERRMEILENERKNALDDQQSSFQLSMQKCVKDMLEESQTSQIAMQQLIDESKQERQILKEENIELRESWKKTMLEMKENDKKNRAYTNSMTQQVEQLQEDLNNKEEDIRQLKSKAEKKVSSCLIM